MWLQDFNKIAIAMSRVDVENADASVAADKVAIGELVKREMGFSEVNKQVIGALREWLAATATAELERLPKAERGTCGILVHNLARMFGEQGKLAQAEPLAREAVEVSREVFGDRHTNTLISIGNLVDLLREAGNLEEAQAALGDVVATAAEVLGERHPLTIVTAAKAARLRHAQPGGAAEGKEALRAVVELMAEVLGAAHFQTCKYNAALEAM